LVSRMLDRPAAIGAVLRQSASLCALVLSCGAALAAEELRFDVTFDDTVLPARDDVLSKGDRVILDDRLTVDGVYAGSVAGLCTVTDPNGIMICSITFRLENGSISTQFANSPPPEKIFALFGGTGAFQGRSGMGVLTEFGDGTGSLVLTVD
jgi:hypothetical protein